MSEKFNAAQYLKNLERDPKRPERLYLETKYRLMWLRAEHPDAGIATELLQFDPPVVKATIVIDGAIVATGHGMAIDKGNATWAGRAIEKAETAAIGRALAHAGYGTQFVEEDEELADSPIEKTAPQSRQNGAARPAPAPAATITSAAPQSAAEPQLELVGLYGLTPEQMDAPATAQSIWEAVYENLTAFKFNARPHAKNAVAPMMSDLIGKPLREALEIIRTRNTHQGEIA